MFDMVVLEEFLITQNLILPFLGRIVYDPACTGYFIHLVKGVLTVFLSLPWLSLSCLY
jgi:hypothetical protein